jgi:hypothetical protein
MKYVTIAVALVLVGGVTTADAAWVKTSPTVSVDPDTVAVFNGQTTGWVERSLPNGNTVHMYAVLDCAALEATVSYEATYDSNGKLLDFESTPHRPTVDAELGNAFDIICQIGEERTPN